VNRRQFLIRGIGAAIMAGAAPTFLPSLLPEVNVLTAAPRSEAVLTLETLLKAYEKAKAAQGTPTMVYMSYSNYTKFKSIYIPTPDSDIVLSHDISDEFIYTSEKPFEGLRAICES